MKIIIIKIFKVLKVLKGTDTVFFNQNIINDKKPRYIVSDTYS